MDASSTVPLPANEPNLGYAPDSPERGELEKRLVDLQSEQHRADRHHRRRDAVPAAARSSSSCSRTTTSTCSA